MLPEPVPVVAAGWCGRLRRQQLVAVLMLPLASLAHAAFPDFSQVRAAHRPSEAVWLDRHGQPLQVSRIDRSVRRLAWVPLRQIAPVLQGAVIASEDQRFAEHSGVDWQAAAGALVERLQGSPRGASTLSMQLAGLLDADLKPGSDGRSVLQKLAQVSAARGLEQRWSKAQILEAYLNLASFRGELQGIGAAAAGLFGKQPHGLNQGEAILLAALLRGPNAAADVVARRSCELAAQLKARVGCAYLQGLGAQALAARSNLADIALAPELPALLPLRPGERRKTTLDADLQAFVRDVLQRQIVGLRERNVNDAAAVVLDNASGAVLAYVGNIGRQASASQVDGAAARRQAGSTLKPFIYALAFEQRYLTPASLLDDSPVHLDTPSGLYVPQNYDKNFHGTVSARRALAGSLNVPAVRTLLLTGTAPAFNLLQQLGFNLPYNGDHYGFALALGAPDVTLLQLTNAYRALANGGRYSASSLSGSKPAWRSTAIGTAASWLAADILSDRSARSITFGLENPLATRYWSAVKTGTSKDMRDNWCVGFSRRYSVGVWVGNFSGEPMWDVSGVTGAAPAWLEILNRLHATQPSLPPAAPKGIVPQAIRYRPPTEPPRHEYFIAGTEQTVWQAADSGGNPIRYPGQGEVIALDPDIPASHQQIWLRAERAGEWWLDGMKLGSGANWRWTPSKGKHRLRWQAGQGGASAQLQFEVRAAQ